MGRWARLQLTLGLSSVRGGDAAGVAPASMFFVDANVPWLVSQERNSTREP